MGAQRGAGDKGQGAGISRRMGCYGQFVRLRGGLPIASGQHVVVCAVR